MSVTEWLVTSALSSGVTLTRLVVGPYWTWEVELESVVQLMVALVSPGAMARLLMNAGGAGCGGTAKSSAQPKVTSGLVALLLCTSTASTFVPKTRFVVRSPVMVKTHGQIALPEGEQLKLAAKVELLITAGAAGMKGR